MIQNRAIQEQLSFLVFNWNSEEVSEHLPEDRKWWEFWKINPEIKKDLHTVGRYLLEGIDDFIQIVFAQQDPKSTNLEPQEWKDDILKAASLLYNVVIQDAKIPWYMLPFKSSIKTILIDVAASVLIDYLIRKYSKNWG